MTSPANHEDTREFFAKHQWFGLPEEDIFLFSQDLLPALDPAGKVLLAAPDRLFLAPSGHGGVLASLMRSGALDDMRERGLATLSHFQVDNPLVRPADPLFIGLHAMRGAGMSSKVVAKRGAGEKVGVLGRIDGKMGCIEYSDLPPNLREARTPAGELLFQAGNIAVHLIEVDFLDELTCGGLRLPWHVARKRMGVVDGAGKPTERDGVKFETFVFDALGESSAGVTLEVDRALEFSPVKNAEGDDSPESSRRDLCRLFTQFVLARGAALPEPDAHGDNPVEIDPLLAESETEFANLETCDPQIRPNGHVYEAQQP